jgi:hypothetical protein
MGVGEVRPRKLATSGRCQLSLTQRKTRHNSVSSNAEGILNIRLSRCQNNQRKEVTVVSVITMARNT